MLRSGHETAWAHTYPANFDEYLLDHNIWVRAVACLDDLFECNDDGGVVTRPGNWSKQGGRAP
jgi:hypothetical protein